MSAEWRDGQYEILKVLASDYFGIRWNQLLLAGDWISNVGRELISATDLGQTDRGSCCISSFFLQIFNQWRQLGLHNQAICKILTNVLTLLVANVA